MGDKEWVSAVRTLKGDTKIALVYINEQYIYIYLSCEIESVVEARRLRRVVTFEILNLKQAGQL